MKFSNLLPDFPATQPLLLKAFQHQHERCLGLTPGWSLTATRRKLIAGYWLEILHKHFIVLMAAGFVLTVLFNTSAPIEHLLLSLLPVSLLVFLILFFTMYWPLYQLDFLPHLESCVESFRGQQLEGVQKCKKEQYPVLTLMLIHHCYQQMAGMEGGLIKDSYTEILMKQYGVSQKMIDTTLRIVILGQWDRNKERKRTEITDAFEQAKGYFYELSSNKAILLLNRLQQKVLTGHIG